MHSKCQAGPGGESCTHGPACFHFLKPALILEHTQRNHARLISNTLGVSLSHTELWANLARLGHGSCSRELPKMESRQRKKA